MQATGDGMIPAALQIVVSLCAAGTDPSVCRHDSSEVMGHLYGPLVKNEEQCQREGQLWLATQPLKQYVVVITCQQSGEWKVPTPEYGVISEPHYEKLTPPQD